MSAQMMDVRNNCEKAAMMAEEVAIVATGGKSGLSVVGRECGFVIPELVFA